MDSQIPEVLMQRTNKLMAERYITKKQMAERLKMEYLTLWRKLKGKRGIDVVLLMDIAKVLGTSVAYLIGETDDPLSTTTPEARVVIQTNDPSREIISNPGRLRFNNGEVSIDIPDTPTNRNWLDGFIRQTIKEKTRKTTTTTA